MNTSTNRHGTDDPASRMEAPAMWHARWIFYGFAMIAAVLLAIEHRAHLLPFLPWLLLAACPLMHLFMHHGHHAREQRRADGKSSSDRAGTPVSVDDSVRAP